MAISGYGRMQASVRYRSFLEKFQTIPKKIDQQPTSPNDIYSKNHSKKGKQSEIMITILHPLSLYIPHFHFPQRLGPNFTIARTRLGCHFPNTIQGFVIKLIFSRTVVDFSNQNSFSIRERHAGLKIIGPGACGRASDDRPPLFWTWLAGF